VRPDGHEARTPHPLRVALAPDAPVVMAGVRAMLLDRGENLSPVELPATRRGLLEVDVVLYDPLRGVPAPVQPRMPDPAPVLVAYSWSLRSDTVVIAREHGARGLVSKDLTAAELGAAIRSVHAGTNRTFVLGERPVVSAPGRAGGPEELSPRETEVLQMITEGLSNDEIARRLYLSINSVKTYIRTAYRKIGVTRRPQAVLWGVQQGWGERPV
jgi:DNA-binding NarL/FixJ family response regulator